MTVSRCRYRRLIVPVAIVLVVIGVILVRAWSNKAGVRPSIFVVAALPLDEPISLMPVLRASRCRNDCPGAAVLRCRRCGSRRRESSADGHRRPLWNGCLRAEASRRPRGRGGSRRPEKRAATATGHRRLPAARSYCGCRSRRWPYELGGCACRITWPLFQTGDRLSRAVRTFGTEPCASLAAVPAEMVSRMESRNPPDSAAARGAPPSCS